MVYRVIHDDDGNWKADINGELKSAGKCSDMELFKIRSAGQRLSETDATNGALMQHFAIMEQRSRGKSIRKEVGKKKEE